jgi:hypothetical protein
MVLLVMWAEEEVNVELAYKNSNINIRKKKCSTWQPQSFKGIPFDYEKNKTFLNNSTRHKRYSESN